MGTTLQLVRGGWDPYPREALILQVVPDSAPQDGNLGREQGYKHAILTGSRATCLVLRSRSLTGSRVPVLAGAHRRWGTGPNHPAARGSDLSWAGVRLPRRIRPCISTRKFFRFSSVSPHPLFICSTFSRGPKRCHAYHAVMMNLSLRHNFRFIPPKSTESVTGQWARQRELNNTQLLRTSCKTQLGQESQCTTR